MRIFSQIFMLAVLSFDCTRNVFRQVEQQHLYDNDNNNNNNNNNNTFNIKNGIKLINPYKLLVFKNMF